MTIKRALASAIAILALLAVLRVASLRGLVFPVRVAGGSMAETLCGQHYRVRCADCGCPFRCDADDPPRDQLAVCPNCGYGRNELGPVFRGQRVVVDRLAYLLRAPRRGDIVAFRNSDGSLSVKRLMGLPGEEVSISNGDLYLNGRICRKSIAELRQMSVLVHDYDFQPRRTANLPPRWFYEKNPGKWSPLAGGFRYTPGASEPPDDAAAGNLTAGDVLAYRHWRCYPGPYERTAEAPVADNDAYNQATSRELRNVSDLLLSCEVKFEGPGTLELAICSGGDRFQVRVDAAGRQVLLMRECQHVKRVTAPRVAQRRDLQFEFAVADQQVLFAVDGELLLEVPYRPGTNGVAPTSRPVSIVAASSPAEIRRLKLYRDVFYLDPPCRGEEWRAGGPLGDQEFLLLGDNPAVSVDSRHWASPGIHRGQVLGVVLRSFR